MIAALVAAVLAAGVVAADDGMFRHEEWEGRIMVVGDSIFATGPGGGKQWEILGRYYPKAKIDCCAANGMRGNSVYERHFLKRSDEDLKSTDVIIFRIGINDNWFGSPFKKDKPGELSGTAAGYVVRMAEKARSLNPKVKLFLEPYMVYRDYNKEHERHINADMKALADSSPLGFIYIDGNIYGGDNLNNAWSRNYQIDYIHHSALRHEMEGDYLCRWLEPYLAEGRKIVRSKPKGRILLAGDVKSVVGKVKSAYPDAKVEVKQFAKSGDMFKALLRMSDEELRDIDLVVIRAGKGEGDFGKASDVMPQKQWKRQQIFPRNRCGLDLDRGWEAQGVDSYDTREVRGVGPEVVAEPAKNTLVGLQGIRNRIAFRLKKFPMRKAWQDDARKRLDYLNSLDGDGLRGELVNGFLWVKNGVTNEVTTLDTYWKLFGESPCANVGRSAYLLRWKNPRVKIVFLGYDKDDKVNEGLAALAVRDQLNWPFVSEARGGGHLATPLSLALAIMICYYKYMNLQKVLSNMFINHIARFLAVFVAIIALSARAEIEVSDIVNPNDPSDVWGERIQGLGDGNEVALVFRKAGGVSMEYTLPASIGSVWYLVVGGGASGGASSGNSYTCSGGGGAGGYVENLDYTLPSRNIVVSVGNGGSSVVAVGESVSVAGIDGGNSLLQFGEEDPICAYGGGGGAPRESSSGHNGGSGGGAGAGWGSSKNYDYPYGSGTTGQGNRGGTAKRQAGAGGGGGAGGVGESTSSGSAVLKTAGGNGGAGLSSLILGSENWYCAGGGGGGYTGAGGAGGSGGGGAGCAQDSKGTTNRKAGDATTYGSGGGGTSGLPSKDTTHTHTSGAGYQGVVIIRYALPLDEVFLPPAIATKPYNGSLQVADIEGTADYDVVQNEGGTDAGEYDVVFRLKNGKKWEGGSESDLTYKFVITPVVNTWTVSPSIDKVSWISGDAAGVITPGAATYGTIGATIAKDGGTPVDFDGSMPTAPGQYVVTYTPAVTVSYTAPDPASKNVEFEVISNDIVPPFSVVVNGAIDVGLNGTVVTASVPYAVICDVVSDKTVDDVFVLYKLNGASDYAEMSIAHDVALDGSGVGVIGDLMPGTNYWICVRGVGGDTESEVSTPVMISTPGDVTSVSASATFDAYVFNVSGSVNDGLGEYKVTLYWSINNSEEFLNHEELVLNGNKFYKDIPYLDVDDRLTWKIVVENSFTSPTYGELSWVYEGEPSTKTRTESRAITYTWTGAGGDNLWTNRWNWSGNHADCYGYPNSTTYDTAKFIGAAEVDLNGKTIGLVKGAGISVAQNIDGTVLIKNGAINCEYLSDHDFGASGTTIEFRDIALTRGRLGPASGTSAFVFSGNSSLSGIYRPWNISGSVRLGLKDGQISFNEIGGYLSSGHGRFDFDNAVLNLNKAIACALADWHFKNGGRVVCGGTVRFYSALHIYVEVPSNGLALAPMKFTGVNSEHAVSPLEVDVTNYKRGVRVPIITFTTSGQGDAVSECLPSVVAKANGVDVTTDRNACLEWSADDKTLYYKQDSRIGLRIIIK